jgi:hypothetical protein
VIQSNPSTDFDIASALDVAADVLGSLVNAGGPSAPWSREQDRRFVAAFIEVERIRAEMPASTATSAARTAPKRRARKLTLASVAKQASKLGLAVARYEVKPDGSVVIVTGDPEPTDASNPWLADIGKATKQ